MPNRLELWATIQNLVNCKPCTACILSQPAATAVRTVGRPYRMSVYEAAIVDTEPTASVIQCVRRINQLSTTDICRRISDSESIVTWDSDDFALVGDRQTVHDQILTDVAALRSTGCTLRFKYRPAIGDSAEPVTYDQILNLMQADVDFDNSDHI